MPYEKWDVVFIPSFPNQEDSSESSDKPAIILGRNSSNGKLFVCPITTKIKQVSRYKYTILVEDNSPEKATMGLHTCPSLIVLDRHIEISERLVGPRPFGTCPDSIKSKVRELIKKMNEAS